MDIFPLPDWSRCSCDFCKKLTRYFDYAETMEDVKECAATGKVQRLFDANRVVNRVTGPIPERLDINARATAVTAFDLLIKGFIPIASLMVELETAICMAEAADVIRQLTSLDKVKASPDA